MKKSKGQNIIHRPVINMIVREYNDNPVFESEACCAILIEILITNNIRENISNLRDEIDEKFE